MYFKRIEIQGFKSFAEPVTIEFQNGITCVVGPNGSGKSNISDAIRWVLGEQSPKALRGGRMEEVIFAGTAMRKPKGMAEVTLVIDNNTNFLPIDYAEVAIRRRMYRSGESEYSINNNQCRLRDVRELIMDTGIGVDGYSIISQGKISEIVNSKPENRRELFEEAAGITKYRARKEESERKLESTAVNLDRVNDIVEEIESRIGGLKEDSEKAKEYITLRERYRELEINITLKNIENIQVKNEYIKDEMAEITGRLEELRGEKQNMDAEAAAKRSESEALERESGEIRDKLMDNAEVTNEIRNRSRLNEEKKLTFARDQKRLGEEIESLVSKLDKEEANLAALLEGAAEMDGQLERLKAELTAGIGKNARQTALLTQLSEKADALKNSIYEFHAKRVRKESESDSIRSLKDTLGRRREQLEEEKEHSGQSGRETEAALEAASARLKAAEEEMAALAETRASAERTRAELSKREEELFSARQKARILYEQLSARKKTIEEMESNYEGYSQGVRAIMKSGVRGLRGAVAELMEVPAGLETAVETALGAAMQNIVCEDDDSAKAAIRFLKENKAGRLTFLPLRGLRPSGDRRDEKMADKPGCLGYAADRIGFAPELRPVFSYLLGRVVIVETLEDAIRISKEGKGALRFVTLEGEVVNAAGAMTGGAYKNKTANLLERRGEISQLARRLESLTEGKEQSARDLAEAQERKAENADAAQRTERALREKELEQINLKNEIGNIRILQEDLGEKQRKRDLEIRGLEDEQARSLDVTGALAAEIESLKKAEAEAETQAGLAMERHEAEKAVLEEMNEAVTKIRLEAGAAESEKSNGDRILRRVRESIEELRFEKEAKDGALADIARQEEELLSGDFDIDALLLEKEDEKAALERQLSLVQESRADAIRLADELARQKGTLDSGIEAEQGRKYEAEIRQARNDTQLESLKDRLWEEFEISYIQAIEFKKKDFIMNSAMKESREIKNRMKALGDVNLSAIREYETVSERYEFLTEQRRDLLEAMDALRKIIEEMDKTIKENFKTNFDKVVENFSETFSLLFGGGKGELRLEDENNPLECGIEISAQPPGKKLQNMNLLSGGEKTMTAIALMFSILKARPTPFCILDEVEAALDDNNINRFAEYLANF
ncbi:MAG: chromosome segregation protein SMC, partial [Clostridiales Family XIII bacterium]|nr:chromosome segregation protein SMC [Clostridiales Family XIII bacterium]